MELRAPAAQLVEVLDELQFRAGALLMVHGANGSRSHPAVRQLEESRDRAAELLSAIRREGGGA
ncbi:MAG: hypothetical protein AAF726_17900 [Planctomycetota bacterium]